MNEQKPAKVVIHALEPQPMLERLKQRHPTVEAIGCSSYGQLPSCLKTFQPDIYYGIRFDGTAGFPRDALFGEFGPNWISIGGSGVDHLHHWDTERVQVTNASGVAASMMAEFMLGGFLHFNLDVEGLERDKAARVWQADRQMIPLSGKTLLIVGLGQTGCALAHRAKALGMHVIGTRARVKPTPDVDEVFTARQLNQVLPRADYIAVCVPLLSSTQDLIDKDAFKQMNADVVLADVSRGGVVNGQALLEALNSASIRGAILDVFETEPLPAEHLLWQAKNVLISPHCSSVFEGWEIASFDMFCENLDNYLTGEPLNNLIDPDLGY